MAHKEAPEGEEAIELLIGLYFSDAEARAAIERVKGKPSFSRSKDFEVCLYRLNRQT